MTTPETPGPAERFAIILRWLTQAVVTRSAFGLSQPLIALIIDRLREINQRVARLAARIHAGTYAPRRRTARRPPLPGLRRPTKLPKKFGWLLEKVPEAVGYRSQLEFLLRDENMAALLAAAPASLGRPIRSLCWMLRLAPPENLRAPEKKPRPPPKTGAAPAAAVPPPPPRPQPPAWMRGMRRSLQLPARVRGPPRPA